MKQDQLSKARQVVHRLLPEPEIRAICLSLFAEAISNAHRHGPEKWAVHLKSNRLRLIVGGLIVFSVEPGRTWMALDCERLDDLAEHRVWLEESNSWQWDEVEYPTYKRISSWNGYYAPGSDHSETWPVVRELHFAFVARSASVFRKIKEVSRSKHASAVLELLRRELDRPILELGLERTSYEVAPGDGFPFEIGQLLSQLQYKHDVRRPPNERRRGRFRTGWQDATERGEAYADDTLEQLTWQNLGYRFGRYFGHQLPEQVDQVFELLAESYKPSGPGSNQVSAAVPSSQQYVAAFRRIGSLTDGQIQMLCTHYYAPDRIITATEMARAAGHEHYSFANSQYGRLGRLVGEQLEYNPMQERLGTLVTFEKHQGEWHWIMRPEVAQALEQLGWVEDPVSFPGETQAQEDSVTGKTLYSIVSEVNLRAKEHPIGELQEIRKDLKGKRKLQQDVFRPEDPKTTSEEWAFHYGGRTELQFNIGFERVDGIDELRHGVAFSLQTNQTLPKIDVLVPKVKLFNDFIQLYSEKYADMRMWHHIGGERSSDSMPTSIPPELVTEGAFIFLGKRQLLEQLDYELILNDLDRLLPLYKYVESGGTLQPVSVAGAASFAFYPGCTVKRSSTIASQAQRELDVNLRHNDLQEALYRQLADEYGAENVGTELSSGVGTSVDVVVRQEDGFSFYEIKTARSPRACLRQALGQLFEYAFWPGAQEATRLIVVGETALDEEGAEYLRMLRERFSLPIEYEQIVV